MRSLAYSKGSVRLYGTKVVSDDELPATELFRKKIRALEINQKTHYAACEKYIRNHKRLGALIIVLSSIALASAFADVALLHPNANVLVGVGALIIAILSGIITFSGFSELASEHKSAGVQYGKLLRFAEARISGAFSDEENKREIEGFLQEWRRVSESAPLTKLAIRKNEEDA